MSGTIRFFNVTPVGRILNRFSKGELIYTFLTASGHPADTGRYRNDRLVSQLRASDGHYLRREPIWSAGGGGCYCPLVPAACGHYQLAVSAVLDLIREPQLPQRPERKIDQCS